MMTKQERGELLRDHVDARMVATDISDSTAKRNAIVQLDPDHPGFLDAEYRARRNRIAQLALVHEPGSPIPDAPYTPEEHQLWRTIWASLAPAHERHACTEYLEAIGL